MTRVRFGLPPFRGLTLEHATIDAGVRLNEWLGANLAIGTHVGEAELSGAEHPAVPRDDGAVFAPRSDLETVGNRVRIDNQRLLPGLARRGFLVRAPEHLAPMGADITVVPASAGQALWDWWATKPKIDVAAVDALEAVVKHDVIAFLTHLAEIVFTMCIKPCADENHVRPMGFQTGNPVGVDQFAHSRSPAMHAAAFAALAMARFALPMASFA